MSSHRVALPVMIVVSLVLGGRLAAYAQEAEREGAGEPDVAAPPPGSPRTPTTTALETAANVVQSTAPLDQMGIHLVGFHPMKDEPSHQMEAHHFCNQVNQDFMQCVLFDGAGEDARLNGIEYIVTEKLFQQLPLEERSYWHPHNYEILSGQLVAPGVPGPAEKELMAGKINSYGKTWHVWMSKPFGMAGDALPVGKAHLAWSFNRDGEAKPGMVEARDRQLGVDTAEKKRERADLRDRAHRQEGEDALAGLFEGPPPEAPKGE